MRVPFSAEVDLGMQIENTGQGLGLRFAGG